MAEKRDCFGWKRAGKCIVLNVMNCDGCKFYKTAGTECDTCHNKDTANCRHCRGGK